MGGGRGGGGGAGGRPRGGEARFIITRTIKFNKNLLQSGVGRSIMIVGWKSAFSINKTSNKHYEGNASEDSAERFVPVQFAG